jgi:hypothetical protein
VNNQNDIKRENKKRNKKEIYIMKKPSLSVLITIVIIKKIKKLFKKNVIRERKEERKIRN